MAKLTLQDLASLANQTTAIATINANNALIETALENTLSRDGTSPNQMDDNIDMDSNRIYNLPDPLTNSEAATRGYVDTLAGLFDPGNGSVGDDLNIDGTLEVDGTVTFHSTLTMDNNDAIRSRNAANNANIEIVKLNTSDELELAPRTATGTNVIITTSEDGASTSPILYLHRFSASPAVSDNIGAIGYAGRDSAGNFQEYARTRATIVSPTSTTESGGMIWSLTTGGTLTDQVTLTPGLLAPVTNDGLAIGTGTLSISDIFLANGGVINFNNGNYTVIHSAGLLTTNGALTLGGAATCTNVVASGSITSNSPTAGVGYRAGAGGTVTQATSKSTGVTLNTITGQITMNNAALAAATIVSFTLTNSAISSGDLLVLNHIATGTSGAYTLNAQSANGSATITIRNNTAGSLGEALVIGYAVIKAVTA